jgi:O-antigen/teichoic acid export membrane protein
VSVVRNTLSLTTARLASKCLAFVAGVLVARQLGASLFGQYNIVIAFVLIFSFLADFGMVSLLIREVAGRPNQTAQLLSDGMAAQLAVSAVATLALVGVGFSVEHSGLIRMGLVLGASALAIESLGRPFTAVIIGTGHLATAAVLVGVASVSNTLLLLLALVIFHTVLSLFAVAIPVAVISTLLAAGIVLQSPVRVRCEVSFPRVRRLLSSAAPFALLAGSAVLYDRVDVLMLSWLDTNSAVGVFSAADRVIEGLLVIPAAVGAALYPVMSADVPAATERLRSALRWSFPLCAIVTGLCLFPGGLIVSRLYGSHYAGVADAFLILAPTVVLGGLTVPLAYLLQAERRTSITVLATVVGLATDLGLDVLLIPRFSVVGAATSATLAEVTILVTLLVATVAHERPEPRARCGGMTTRHSRHSAAKA